MAPLRLRLLALLALGSAPAPCRGETLGSSSRAADDVVTAMMDDLKTTVEVMRLEDPVEALPGVANALQTLSKLYAGEAMQAHSISVDSDEIEQNFADKGVHSQAAVYGELLPPSAAAMLEFALKNNPNIVWDGTQDKRYEVKSRASERRPKFFDLGSGFGKISMLAALLGFDAGGYELAHQRINEACKALDQLAGRTSSDVVGQQPVPSTEEIGSMGGASVAAAKQGPQQRCALDASEGKHGQLNFFEGSFTDEAVDLQDADVIFTDSVFWDEGTMTTLGAKASSMKPGSIIVSYKKFPDPNKVGHVFDGFEPLTLPTTWSSSTRWQVQRVGTPEANAMTQAGKNLRIQGS